MSLGDFVLSTYIFITLCVLDELISLGHKISISLNYLYLSFDNSTLLYNVS